MPRIVNKSRLAALLLCVFLFYWGLVPVWLPPPALSVDMPAETPVDRNLPIRIHLNAWHSNFEVVQVRFYSDYGKSDVDGPKGPFYPQVLYQLNEEVRWPFTKINRFAFPRHRGLDVVLPLAKLHADRVVKPGTVHGKIDVTLAYPDLHTRTFKPMGERTNRSRMLSQPIKIEFLPPSG
jgi:hypothetical protein